MIYYSKILKLVWRIPLLILEVLINGLIWIRDKMSSPKRWGPVGSAENKMKRKYSIPALYLVDIIHLPSEHHKVFIRYKILRRSSRLQGIDICMVCRDTSQTTSLANIYMWPEKDCSVYIPKRKDVTLLTKYFRMAYTCIHGMKPGRELHQLTGTVTYLVGITEYGVMHFSVYRSGERFNSTPRRRFGFDTRNKYAPMSPSIFLQQFPREQQKPVSRHT